MAAAFRPDIQGLRAFAVLAVLAAHAGVPGAGGGFVGVDVFFVISGFLITGHLLSALDSPDRFSLPEFWARRARRILPASLVVLVAATLAALAWVPPVRLPDLLADATATALYVPNLWFAAQQTDYLAGSAPSVFQHYWSLGVEEQFYLVWPLLLLLAATSRRRMLAAITLVTITSLALCLALAPLSQPWAFFSLPTRAWELGAGGLGAALVARGWRLPQRAAAPLTWLGLAGLVACVLLVSRETAWPGPLTLLPVACALLVIVAGIDAPTGGAQLLLRRAPLQFVGRISYSLYLVHWPLLVIAQENAGLENPLPFAVTGGLAVASVPLAWLLFRFVESPLRARRPLSTRATRRSLLVSFAATVTIVAGLGVAVPSVAAIPLHADRSAASGPLVVHPPGTSFVPENLRPGLAEAASDTGEIYDNGCQQTRGGSDAVTCVYGDPHGDVDVVLFGDSHAGRWFGALDAAAASAGARLTTLTKSGCRSLETVKGWGSSPNASCLAWRAAAMREITALHPDVVVFADHFTPEPTRDAAIQRSRWHDGVAQIVGALPQGTRAVVLADTPSLPADPVPCLSAHLTRADRCATPRAGTRNNAIDDALRSLAAAGTIGYVDLTGYLCSAATCPAIIGNTLVYSDDHHLTDSISRRLAAPLGRALAPWLGHAGAG